VEESYAGVCGEEGIWVPVTGHELLKNGGKGNVQLTGLELLSHTKDAPISELNVMNASETRKSILHGGPSADFIYRIKVKDVPNYTLIFVSMVVIAPAHYINNRFSTVHIQRTSGNHLCVNQYRF
jgi:hypothetical protein